MNQASFDALSRGIEGYRRGVDSAEDKKLRAEMLKRQLEQDRLAEQDRDFDRKMKAKQIELAERGDRRAGLESIDRAMDRSRKEFNDIVDGSRQVRESDARIAHLNAQTEAIAAKPVGPLSAQLAGLDDFGTNMAAALTENSEAMQAQRAAYMAPDEAARVAADTRVLKAQIKLSGLQQIAAGWQKNTQKEATVDLTFPGEDGLSKMTMKVPQSQWNQNHPMWGKFMNNGAAPAAPATSAPAPTAPALSAEDQQALQWAKANPKDPRAAAIIKKLTGQ